MNSRISLRPAVSDDEPFLAQVYGSTRVEELAATGWSIPQKEAFIQMQYQAQRRHYLAEYPHARREIILLEGMPVGRLDVDNSAGCIHVLDLTVIAEHRGQGIGSHLLAALMKDSAKEAKPIRIYVETFNRSLRLFERLGFRRIREAGIHYLMEWVKPSD